MPGAEFADITTAISMPIETHLKIFEFSND